MLYALPGAAGAPYAFKDRYDNFIGGKWVAPVKGEYFPNLSPITGKRFCDVARSTAEDIELALDAAHAAKDAWGATPPAQRAQVLLKIADRLEANLEKIAYVETCDNGKPIRETLAAGNCVVLNPAEATPVGLLVVMELSADLLPPGVINVVNGLGREAGVPLATSSRIAKIAFTGSTTTGRLIMQAASQNIIPVTLELGGKSPNIFFDNVAAQDDAFLDKAIEGFVLFALNQGEVCTRPSRALIQESIYDQFIERALGRVAAIKQGNPLDTDTMVGAQASTEQMAKIMSYIDLGKQEGAECLIGGEVAKLGGELGEGYYIKPTVFKGHNKMRIFQEEIFGPVLSVTTFKDEAEALAIANDTLYGLGAGVWSRDGSQAFRMGRKIQAGRVWTNCYHMYPAHAAFGGYKQSGIGRETHKMMLDHYQQTKNLLVSYSPKALGFF